MGLEHKKARETVEELPRDFWQGKIPCWQMCHCPEAIKNECPATKNSSYPCWEIEGTYCKLNWDGDKWTGTDTSICEVCRVYKKYGDNKPIQLKSLGRGIDNCLNSLGEWIKKGLMPEWR